MKEAKIKQAKPEKSGMQWQSKYQCDEMVEAAKEEREKSSVLIS